MKRFAAAVLTLALAAPIHAAHYAITSVLLKGVSHSIEGKQATSVIIDPWDIAVDPSGAIYGIATYPTRIVKIGSDGLVRTIAGGGQTTPVNGIRATDASLLNARRLAVDPLGVVYVADRSRHQVFRIGTDGILTIYAGTTSGFGGDNGPANAAKLNTPLDLTLDAQGSLYIVDYSNARIRKVTPQGTISTIAGTGTRTTSGDGGPATAAGIASPNYIGVDAGGKLYLTDNKLVRVIDSNGVIRTLAGAGTQSGASVPPANVQFGDIGGMDVAPDGSVYVSASHIMNDHSYPALRLIPPTGNVVSVAGSSKRAITGDGGTATTSALAKPGPVAVGPNNTIFFRDYQVVRRISNGQIQTVAGSHSAAAAGEGGSLADSNLRGVAAIARDAQGVFYLSDFYTESIYRVTSDLTRITRIAGTGYAGETSEDGSGTSVALDRPTDVELDSSGNLFIADTWNGRVRKLTPGGQMSVATGQEADDSKPCIIANDPDPHPYCFMEPAGLRFDKSGNLFINDSVNARVLKMAPVGSLQLFAGRGYYGFQGDGGPATVAGMYWPFAIDFDAAGNAYIADYADHRIRKVTPGGTISTYAGTGTSGFSGDGGPAIAAQINGPSDIRILADGSLLFMDARNNRVRRISSTGIIETVIGGGNTFGDYFEGTAVSIAGDNDYSGSLFLEASGKIWVNEGNRLSWMEPGTIFRNWVFNGASFKTGPVAPGEIVTIYGEDIGPAALTSATYENGNLVRTVANTRALFNGTPAPLIYVSAGQTSVVVPYGVSGTAKLQLEYQGRKSNEIELLVAASAPGVFTYAAGAGQIVAVNQDGSFNGATKPHGRGEWMVIFLTGQGGTAPTIGDGVLPTGPTYPATAGGFQISVGSVPVPSGDIWNGLIYQGVLQVNFKVPETAPTGTTQLTVTIGTAASQAATIELK